MEHLTLEKAKSIREQMDILINELEAPVKKLSTYSDMKNHSDALLFIKLKGIAQKDKTEREKAMDKLIDIADAINEGWTPDWSNGNQKKWRCWFEWDKKTSAFVFYATVYGWTCTNANVGSRLCFESSDKAEFFGENFMDLHNIVLTK